MKTTTKNTKGIKVNTGVKAGGMLGDRNHNRSGLRVKASIKAGAMIQVNNHSRHLLAISI